MDHPRNDVTFSFLEIVIWSIDIARHNRSETSPVLLVIGAVEHVDHTLGVAVSEIAVVRRPIVDLKEQWIVTMPFSRNALTFIPSSHQLDRLSYQGRYKSRGTKRLSERWTHGWAGGCCRSSACLTAGSPNCPSCCRTARRLWPPGEWHGSACESRKVFLFHRSRLRNYWIKNLLINR